MIMIIQHLVPVHVRSKHDRRLSDFEKAVDTVAARIHDQDDYDSDGLFSDEIAYSREREERKYHGE